MSSGRIHNQIQNVMQTARRYYYASEEMVPGDASKNIPTRGAFGTIPILPLYNTVYDTTIARLQSAGTYKVTGRA